MGKVKTVVEEVIDQKTAVEEVKDQKTSRRS